MNVIIKYFTGTPPLPLFVLMTAPYMVSQFTAMGERPIEWGILVVFFLAATLGWIHSIGIASNSRLPQHLRFSVIPMRCALVIPFVCLGYFVLGVLNPLFQGKLQYLPTWIIFIHFLALASIFFSIWFSAKQFTTLRLRRETGFIDYYPMFMAMWFCFIGVWFVQKLVIREFVKLRST